MSAKSLTEAAAALAKSRPDLWRDFIEMFARHSDERARQCVQAPQGEVHIAQGRAQETAYLLDKLSNAVQSVDRVQRRSATRT